MGVNQAFSAAVELFQSTEGPFSKLALGMIPSEVVGKGEMYPNHSLVT
jgi:hypothetical protein